MSLFFILEWIFALILFGCATFVAVDGYHTYIRDFKEAVQQNQEVATINGDVTIKRASQDSNVDLRNLRVNGIIEIVTEDKPITDTLKGATFCKE